MPLTPTLNVELKNSMDKLMVSFVYIQIWHNHRTSLTFSFTDNTHFNTYIIVIIYLSLFILQEQEMEKQKLLFHQARLSNRGVAEMVLLHISASKGVPSDMVMKTLELGIAILRGGNIEIQMVNLGIAREIN